jgi:hypothetical protein
MARASPGVRVAKPKFKGIQVDDVASKPMLKINIVVSILDYQTLELDFLMDIDSETTQSQQEDTCNTLRSSDHNI